MNPVTVLAPIKLAKGKTEADLLAASDVFQKDFVAHEAGVLRRELVRKEDGSFLDIVQFRSAEDAKEVMAREMESEVCHRFFAVMDLEGAEDAEFELMPSLATYS